MSAPVQRIVVAGRDAPLWLAAAVLQAALGRTGVSVVAVELPSRLSEADVHATQPALEALHNRLGLDEAGLLRATGGAFSLGTRLVDAGGAAPAWFHAWGSHGAQIAHKAFFAHWLKARRLGLPAGFEDFCLTAAAAAQGRMLSPSDETEAFGRTDYGYCLPARPYAALLKRLAVRAGVQIHQTVGLDVERAGEMILGLVLDDGRRLDGDVFVDASGAQALLAGRGEREDWKALFPADRVLTARGPRLASLPVFAEVRAFDHGWAGLHPHQAGTGLVVAFAGLEAEAALDAATRISGLTLDVVAMRQVEPGRRRQAWTGNCLALGEAACVLDPLHGPDLHAVQLGLVHFLGLFPHTAECAAERAEYNAEIAQAFDRIRDFQAAHYRLNRYGQGAFWTAARTAAPPLELAHKIDLFLARGDVPPYEHETFLADSWRATFLGHGLVPGSHAPMIDTTPPEVMRAEFRRILAFVRDQVLAQPTHEAYLRDLCGEGAAHG